MNIKFALIFPFLLFCFLNINAQSIGGKSLSKIDSKFILIHEIRGSQIGTVRAKLDYGQELDNHKDGWITDKGGDSFVFPSVVNLMNTLDEMGYELFEAVARNDSDHFSKLLFRKREIGK